MSEYFVWDAGKEKADVWEVEENTYTTPPKHPERYIKHKSVSATAVCHMLCGSRYRNVLSPGEFEKQWDDLVNAWALKCTEAGIEAQQPVVWTHSSNVE